MLVVLSLFDCVVHCAQFTVHSALWTVHSAPRKVFTYLLSFSLSLSAHWHSGTAPPLSLTCWGQLWRDLVDCNSSNIWLLFQAWIPYFVLPQLLKPIYFSVSSFYSHTISTSPTLTVSQTNAQVLLFLPRCLTLKFSLCQIFSTSNIQKSNNAKTVALLCTCYFELKYKKPLEQDIWSLRGGRSPKTVFSSIVKRRGRSAKYRYADLSFKSWGMKCEKYC